MTWNQSDLMDRATNNRKGIYTQETAITPEMASRWLVSSNSRNRPFIPNRIAAYAHIMIAGKWMLTHQGIAFDEFDELVDGQNRLSAVVLAGVTVRMLVTRGISRESMGSIDNGKPRTTADSLGLMGEDCSQQSVAVMKALLASYRHERGTPSGFPSGEFVLKTFHSAMAESIRFATYSPSVKRLSHACFVASMAAAWHTQDRERISSFKAQVRSGIVTCEEDNAAIRIREVLLSGVLSNGGHSKRYELFLKSCAALGAYLARRPITKLYSRSSARFPIPSVGGVK